MKKINLAITGCLGRMGNHLIESTLRNNAFKLVALTENKNINRKISGIKPTLNIKKTFEKSDIIIDFTIPECTLQILETA